MEPIPTAVTGCSYKGDAGKNIGDLPVLKTGGTTTSWWRPSDAELEMLVNGGAVAVTSASTIIFPFSVYACALATAGEYRAAMLPDATDDELPARLKELIEEGSDLPFPVNVTKGDGTWIDAHTVAKCAPSVTEPDEDGPWWFHTETRGWVLVEVMLSTDSVFHPGVSRETRLSSVKGKGFRWVKPLRPAIPSDGRGGVVGDASMSLADKANVDKVNRAAEIGRALVAGRLPVDDDSPEEEWSVVATVVPGMIWIASLSGMLWTGPAMRTVRNYRMLRRAKVGVRQAAKLSWNITATVRRVMLSDEEMVSLRDKAARNCCDWHRACAAALAVHDAERQSLAFDRGDETVSYRVAEAAEAWLAALPGVCVLALANEAAWPWWIVIAALSAFASVRALLIGAPDQYASAMRVLGQMNDTKVGCELLRLMDVTDEPPGQ